MSDSRGLFNDRWVQIATIVFIIIVVLAIPNLFFDLPDKSPLLGLLTLSLIPILFIIDAVIFIAAILKS